jgi:hypothetical protein
MRSILVRSPMLLRFLQAATKLSAITSQVQAIVDASSTTSSTSNTACIVGLRIGIYGGRVRALTGATGCAAGRPISCLGPAVENASILASAAQRHARGLYAASATSTGVAATTPAAVGVAAGDDSAFMAFTVAAAEAAGPGTARALSNRERLSMRAICTVLPDFMMSVVYGPQCSLKSLRSVPLRREALGGAAIPQAHRHNDGAAVSKRFAPTSTVSTACVERDYDDCDVAAVMIFFDRQAAKRRERVRADEDLCDAQ